VNTAAGIELSVALSYSGIFPGEPTLIMMTLVNRNSFPVTLRYDTTCHVLYYIESPAGAIVVPNTGAWSCAPSTSSVQLAPYQAIFSSATFTGQSIGADGAPVDFPSGVYSVYATFAPNPLVRSAPVALTIH
jgi:hypothetical protein